MKHRFLVLCVLLLLFALTLSLVACNDTPATSTPTTSASSVSTPETTEAPPSTDAVDEAFRRTFAADWSKYLVHKESLCLDMSWMLSYVEAFYEQPSLSTLTNARAALGSLEAHWAELSFPTYTLTPEQHTELIAAGYDVSGIWEEMNRWESSMTEFLDTCQILFSDLYFNAFFTPSFQGCQKYTQNAITGVEITLEQLAVFTDNVILSLKSETIRDDFLAFIQENTPAVAKYLPAFSQTLSANAERQEAVLDKLEANINELNTIVGELTVAADQLADLFATNNIEQLTASLVDLGDGFCFPLPFFDYSKDTFFYFYSDGDTQDIFAPQAPITLTPNRLVIESAVSKEDHTEYLEILLLLGFTPVLTDDSDTALLSYYKLDDDNSVLIEWEDQVMTFIIVGADIYPLPQYCFYAS